MNNINQIIDKFINGMQYLENNHVLGIFFYGSFLTGYNDENSDIDLHIVFDNSDPNHLIRGSFYIDNRKIEYFEKPIKDIYLSIENDFQNQNNAMLSIIGTARIIFDRNGQMKKLQQYAFEKFSNPMPKLDENDAKEYVSILRNRMAKLKKAATQNSPYFLHLYHLTIEKIRKFYHRLNGMPEVQTSKVFRVYTDEDYRKSFYKDNIPEEEFINMYLDAVNNITNDKQEMLQKAQSLFNFATKNIDLDKYNYRILIKSRNIYPRK